MIARRLAPAILLALAACDDASHAPPSGGEGGVPSRPTGEDRVHVLVGRRGDVAFFLYPQALVSGLDREPFARHASQFGIPADRMLLRMTVFHLGREGPVVEMDPRTLVLRFRGPEEEALAVGLSSLDLEVDSVRAPILNAWIGGPVALAPGHAYHAGFLMEDASHPPERDPPLLHGSFEVVLDGEKTVVYLADARIERRNLLEYLRHPGRYLLDLEPVKRAFRAD